MRKNVLLYGLLSSCMLLSSTAISEAQIGQNLSIIFSSVSYTGPGDVVSGATFWVGLRAYKKSYATGSNNAITVRNQKTSSTSNIVILSNGSLDVATAATFAGTDATATCTVSGTTGTCSGASSTPTVNDQVYGAGLTNPCLATAVGTFTGGAGSVTLALPNGNSCGTISSGVTLTFQVALFIAEFFDQTGNGINETASGSAQPQLIFDAVNTNLPCALNYNSSQIMNSSSTVTPATGNGIVSLEYIRSINTNPFTLLRINGNNNQMTLNAANSLRMAGSGGTFVGATASDGNLHAVNGMMDGSSSALLIDGTNTSGSMTGATTASNPSLLRGVASTTVCLTEAGYWDNNTSGSLTGLHSNMSAYWGSP
jgi:hypothetical protein